MPYLLLCLELRIFDSAIKGVCDVDMKLTLCPKCLDAIQEFQKQPEKFSLLSSLLCAKDKWLYYQCSLLESCNIPNMKCIVPNMPWFS